MKRRVLVLLLAAALAAPAGARPAIRVPHRVATWSHLWQGFLGFFEVFERLGSSDASDHGFPPPACTTSTTFQ